MTRLRDAWTLGLILACQLAWAQALGQRQRQAGLPKGLKSGTYTLEKYEAAKLDALVSARMEQISKMRQRQIERLQKLLEQPYYQKKAEIYFRLAENYREEALYQYLKARKAYERDLEKYDAGVLTKKPVEPREDYSRALAYYKKILQEFPTYSRIDEVLYYLGKGALREGKVKHDERIAKEGTGYLNRLVKDHPRSRFVPNALLALAEYYFEHNSLYWAKQNYERIINEFPRSPMYNYALYKLAWVYFNMTEYDKAVETFQRVVEAVSKVKTKGIIEFRDQALNDLVKTYAEMENGWVLARDYFLKVLPEDRAYKKLRALGDLLVAEDKDEEAIALFRHFIEREKISQHIPEYYKIILEIHKKVSDYTSIDRVVAEAMSYFKPEGTWYTVMKREHPEAITEANDLCEYYLRLVATHYHKEAQRRNDARLYKLAAERYASYLKRFSNYKFAYEVNFYYAEILYDKLHDYKKAAEQYQKVIERDKKGEYLEDAALGIIYCYEELMYEAGIHERARKGKKVEVVKVDPKKASAPIKRTELHGLEKKYVWAADQYVRLLRDRLKDPNARQKNPHLGEKIPEIMFIAAQVFYRHGQFKEAVNRLKVLFDYAPDSEFAAYGVFTLLDCYQRLKRWDKVEEWARKLIKVENFKVKSKRELEKIVAIAITENARILSMERKYSKAIQEAMRVYREFRHDKVMASKALFNVAALYEGQKQIKDAVRTYLRVVKEYPKSKVAPEALYTVGLIYESQTQFARAASTFEKLVKFPKYKRTPDALQNAGLIWEALERYGDAIRAYRTFVRLFPKHKDAPLVELRIGVVYETMGKKGLILALKQYHDWLRRYNAVSPQQVEVFARAGAVLKKIEKKRNRRKAVQMFTQALAAFKKLPADPKVLKKCKYYAAEAAFELADYLYDDFAEAKIPSTLKPQVLKKALETKARLEQKAEKAFEQVLEFKSGGWSAGALLKIGLMYYNFADELNNVPVPEGLPPEVEMEYTAILEDMARPVWDKALKAFERALKLAHELKVYNRFSRLCAEYAKKVNPDAFPVAGDELLKPVHTKDTLASTSFIRSLRRGDVEVRFVKEASK